MSNRLEHKLGNISSLTTALFITFLIMENTTSLLGLAALILWGATFAVIAYKNIKESQEIDERTKMMKEHRDRESLIFNQYESLLQQRNEIISSANEDLRTKLDRMNQEAIAVTKVEKEVEQSLPLVIKKRGRPVKKKLL